MSQEAITAVKEILVKLYITKNKLPEERRLEDLVKMTVADFFAYATQVFKDDQYWRGLPTKIWAGKSKYYDKNKYRAYLGKWLEQLMHTMTSGK